MVAHSNKDVDDLNRMVREKLKQSGAVAQEEVTIAVAKDVEVGIHGTKEPRHTKREYEELNFAVGDQLIFKKNDFGLQVKNGTIGEITAVDAHKVKVMLKGTDTREVSFSPTLYPYFRHGWVVTINAAQGTTVHNVKMLASFEQARNLSYVGFSRHRDRFQIYGSGLEFNTQDLLVDRLSRSHEKLTGVDYKLEPEQIEKVIHEDDRLITRLWKKYERTKDSINASVHFVRNIFHEPSQIQTNFGDGNGSEPERAIKVLGIDSNTKEDLVPAPLIQKQKAEQRNEVDQRLAMDSQVNTTTRKQDSHDIAHNTKVDQAKPKQPYSYQALVDDLQQQFNAKQQEKWGKSPSQETKQRHGEYAIKVAEYLCNHYIRTSEKATANDVDIYSKRAELEVQRAKAHKYQWLSKHKNKQELKPEDVLKATLYGERLATIEGKHYERYLRDGHKLRRTAQFKTVALNEYAQNEAHFENTVANLSRTDKIAPDKAKLIATQVIQYKEKYGLDPTQTQTQQFEQIADYISKREHELVRQYRDLPECKPTHVNEFVLTQEQQELYRLMAVQNQFPNQQQLRTLQQKIQNKTSERLQQAYHQLERGLDRERGLHL